MHLEYETFSVTYQFFVLTRGLHISVNTGQHLIHLCSLGD